MKMLEMIEERYDCSDFLMRGMIRYLHNYPVEGAMKKRIKRCYAQLSLLDGYGRF